MEQPKVAVCVPSHDRWHADFGVCLVDAIASYTRLGGLVGLIASQGTMLHEQRNDLVREAKRAGATHLFWNDCDQTFPADIIARLLAHNLPVVGANIMRRVAPYTPCSHKGGQPVYTPPWRTGTEEVDTMGLGLTLTRAELFDGDGRWFSFEWDEATEGPLGEDVGFFRKLAKAGIKPVIDHDLSKLVGHLGTVKVTTDLAIKTRTAKVKHGA